MTLFALQLESILNRNPHLLPPMTPNRIIDRADADRLLNFQGEIVEAIGTPDPAAQLHVDGQAMAAEIHDYLNQAVEQMERAGLNGAAELRKIRDYAAQLQAHHLDKLERLIPA